MKDNHKTYIINISTEITNEFITDEIKSFEIFSSSYLDEILSEEADNISEHSHFGAEESLMSYMVLGIVAWVATTLAEEGLKITKHAMYDWMKSNRPKLEKKSKSKKYLKALEILEKYLAKEVDDK